VVLQHMQADMLLLLSMLLLAVVFRGRILTTALCCPFNGAGLGGRGWSRRPGLV
jgi:hypothetical protein